MKLNGYLWRTLVVAVLIGLLVAACILARGAL